MIALGGVAQGGSMDRALGSRYVVGERLGGGGMGTVYRAVRRDGGPDRAVKMLRPELAEDPVILARFVQERVLMLALRGPHLVVVEDLIVDGDMVAIVMELVTGGTLRSYLKARGPLDEATALNAVRQVLLGLGVVHGHGIVHRDLKPENVLLASTADDAGLTAKVTDFGIARALDGPHLTAAFDYVGTPHYSAPEVAEGRIVTPAADVYAAGVMLYELLSGATPFAGDAWIVVMKKQLEQAPARPDVISDPVWSIISRWLAADPGRRPADAWEALRDLDTLVAPAPGPAGRLLTPMNPGSGPPAMESEYGPVIPAPAPPIFSLPGQGAFSPAGQKGVAAAQTGGAQPVADKTSVQQPSRPAPPATDFLEVIHDDPRVVRTPTSFSPSTPLPAPTSNPSNHPSIVPGFGPSVPDGGSYSGSHEPPPPGPRSRRNRLIAIVAACVVVAAVIGGALVTLGGKSTVKQYSLQFPPASYPASGVTVDRTWTVTGGKHPNLRGVLVFHTSKPIATEIEEILPASMVANGQVSFDPQPQVVESGRIVRYALPATAGLTITDSYDVPIAADDVSMTVLQRWADDQAAEAGARYRASHSLRSIAFALAAIKVSAGESAFLPIAGTQANGTAAPTVALGGVQFQVADPQLATVSALGLVKGLAKGITTVRATLGPLSATIGLYVTAAVETSPSSPVRPGSPASLTPGSSPSTVQPSASSASVTPPVGTSVPPDTYPTGASPTAPPPTTAPGTSINTPSATAPTETVSSPAAATPSAPASPNPGTVAPSSPVFAVTPPVSSGPPAVIPEGSPSPAGPVDQGASRNTPAPAGADATPVP